MIVLMVILRMIVVIVWWEKMWNCMCYGCQAMDEIFDYQYIENGICVADRCSVCIFSFLLSGCFEIDKKKDNNDEWTKENTDISYKNNNNKYYISKSKGIQQ